MDKRKERRMELLRRHPTMVRHGTVKAFRDWGCTCDKCRDAVIVDNDGKIKKRPKN